MSNPPTVDTIHYVRIPKGMGARAEMVRMAYVLAGKPYADALHTFQEAGPALEGKNPFKQLPVVVTPSGQSVYQCIAIMHHVGHGTPVWPADPAALTLALEVAVGAYDLYQAFGAFPADDEAARKKFEGRRAPQYFGALSTIYATRKFAAGEAPCFADVIAHQAVAWCVRRNEVCKKLLEESEPLKAFMTRFESIPAIDAFMKKQAAARAVDDAL